MLSAFCLIDTIFPVIIGDIERCNFISIEIIIMQTAETNTSVRQTVKLDIASDYICPWCYIGKQRLQKAINALSNQFDFEINFLPFQLNPEMPESGLNRKEYRSKKFGSWEKSQAMDVQVTEAGKSEGLEFNYDKVLITPNTLKAHLLTAYAQAMNKHELIAASIFKAYFTDGKDIGNTAVLLDIAKEEGLNIYEVQESMQSVKNKKHLNELEELNRERGINSVPVFIIGQ